MHDELRPGPSGGSYRGSRLLARMATELTLAWSKKGSRPRPDHDRESQKTVGSQLESSAVHAPPRCGKIIEGVTDSERAGAKSGLICPWFDP